MGIKNFSEQEILEFTEEEIELLYLSEAYPIIPTDEYGNPERFEAGCVPWKSCTSITITHSEIEEEEAKNQEENFIANVIITCNWEWSGEEEETNVELFVPVYADEDGKLEIISDEVERID